MNRAEFAREVGALGIQPANELLDRFEAFEEDLYAANEVMNLTRVPRSECKLRHFVDSLLFHDLIPNGATVLDIGSGPGFPAWPLACARPDLRVTAIDSSGKMIGFLSGNLLPNLGCEQIRAEEWEARNRFDVVTGRAVAPLAVQLEISASPCCVGGSLILMRTPAERSQLDTDVKELGITLAQIVERRLPGTDILRLYPVYKKTQATPKRFPRSWAEIKRAPIF